MAENQVYLIKSGQNSFVEETEAIIGISGGRLGVGTTTPEADLHVTGSVKVGGDLAVDGTFTTINSSTVSVDDKNIELGSTENPTDLTADGGGITVKGTTDKTFNWIDATDAWTSSEHLYLVNGKHFSADELRALDSDGLKLADQTTSGILIKGGKVGIHRAAPVYDLDVDGSGNFASLYVDGNAVLTGEGSIFGKWEDGATEGEIFYTGGHVGVGTNNPEHPLHVVGSAAVHGNFIVNGTSGNLNVSNFNVSGDSIVLNYLGDTLASNRGGLIVKDSSNASKSLEYVEGSDFWLSSESVQIADGKELQTDKVRAIGAGGLSLQDDGGNGIFIEDGGQLGVNTTSPNYNLDVNGSAKIGSDFYAGNAFKISAGGAVGDIAPASDGDIIKWDDTNNKWVAGANVGGGGGGGVGEVPLATIDSLPSGQSIYQIDFAETYNVEPRIATQLEIDGEGSIIPYVVSGVSTSGYHLIFAQDIPNNNYRIHTTFGGRDVHWETGAGASLYYNDGDVNIQRNFTIGGNLTVNGTTTTVNTETVEIEDHNLVIAANTGYNQLTSEYPGAGGAYAGILWGTGDAGSASPVSLTYQTNKGFAFEGGNVGIGTTNPGDKLDILGNSTNFGISITNGNNPARVTLKNNEGDATIDANNGLLRLGNSTSEDLVIDSAGNVGIGISNPQVPLEVNGGVDNSVVFRGRCDSATSHTGSGAGNNGRFNLVAFSSDAGNDYGGGIKIQTRDGDNVFHDRMTIDEGGNVGIGTTNPDTKLHIEVKDDSTGIGSANNRPGAVLRLTHDAQWQTAYGSPTSDVDYLGGIEFETKDTSGGTGVRTAIKTTVDHYANANSLVFYTAPNSTVGILERLRIQGDNGNVGIGATNPGAKLHVTDLSVSIGSVTVTDSGTGVTGGTALDTKISNGDRIKINNEIFTVSAVAETTLTLSGTPSTAGTYTAYTDSNGLVVTSAGNVGIGTTNPVFVVGGGLEIEKSGVATLRLQNVGDGHSFELQAKADTVDFNDYNDKPFVFKHNTTEQVRIASSGNVGIGTTNPGSKFHIRGDGSTETKLTIDSGTTNHAASISFAADSERAKILGGYDSGGGGFIKFNTDTVGGTATDRMIIDNAGNVGIGTTNPSVKLDIQGSSNTSSKLTLTRTDVGRTAVLSANADSPACPFVGSQSNNDFAIYTNNSAKMLIDTNGNVGIGISNPQVPLEVNGGVDNSVVFRGRCDSATSHTGSGAGNNGRFNLVAFSSDAGNDYGGGIKIQTRDGDNVFHDRMTIDEGGNVGIGTTNPGAKLHVTDLSVSIGDVTVTDSGTGVTGGTALDTKISNGDRIKINNEIFTVSAVAETTLTLSGTPSTAGTYTAYTDNNGLIVTSSGNVGIGTTSPAFPLTVHQDASGSLTSDFVHESNNQPYGIRIRFSAASPANKINYFLKCQVSETPNEKMVVWSNGDIETALGNSIGTLSDIRTKDSVVDATPKLSDVMKLRVVNFTRKNDPDKTKLIGFVAQEVEEVFPRFVASGDNREYDEDGNVVSGFEDVKSVKFDSGFAILTKAIQEQQAIIEDLKSQNASLESRISALES